ncbi:hypothetical protein RRX38_06215 [Pseudomonas sp. DTU_2021_1001937_2_SI_NGA_ILE_001]|uniref:hypothetical protein n=1 Tax=Pseudomonas sp. DTU_2021_1001937_2_SI_NGA_ILE_001 TaxID=3077589 RepID=UPI0028FC0A98|nr:hypothetical protein [Pseudomonas sp. DTU_2021_1001937_2_SI_NGA_ILE_001]WNW10765.1 hypothetical protein RRX38_06215 [Pseudomonas sp. DTU_2021_1001937_2_SI_NGA_ILE_001]
MSNAPAIQPRELPGPVVEGLLPDDPQWDQTHLLPTAATYVPLPVEVPAWEHLPIPGQKTLLKLFWTSGVTTQLVEQREWHSDDHPDAIPDQDRYFTVPVLHLVQGEHQVWYELTQPSGSVAQSGRTPVTIDLTPPVLNVNERLVFDTATVDWQYLLGHDDRLQSTLPAYQVAAPGDVLSWYWGAGATSADLAGCCTLTRNDIGQPIKVVFEGQLIRDRGDGQRYASYKIEDRAGNASRQAQATALMVAAHKPPRRLPAPRIKEAAGSGSNWLLDPLNGINGVTLVIPPDAVLYETDQVFMQWAQPGELGSWRGDTETAPGSREYRVPVAHVSPHIGHTNVPVYYEVVEAGVDDPQASSESNLKVGGLNGLPTVQCDAIRAGEISIAAVDASGGQAHFSLQRWSFMASGQLVNLQVNGLDQAGQMLSIEVLVRQPVDAAVEVFPAGKLSSTELRRFKVGSPLEIKASVSFDNGTTWQAFGTANATLRA